MLTATLLLLTGTLLAPDWPNTGAAVPIYTAQGNVGLACAISSLHAYTANHVLEGSAAQVTWYPNGPAQPQVLLPVWHSGKHDLARLLAFTEHFKTWAPMAAEARAGEEVLLVNDSFYDLKTRVYFRGFIAGMMDDHTVVLDIAGAPGSSGGCVLNARGELVAIYRGAIWWKKHPQVRSLGYATPVWGRPEDVEK